MKKKLIVATTAGALTLAAGSAFALENEFHGMYKFIGMETNFFNGAGASLAKDAHSGWYAENRARLQYIAKANDNLKLVTTFELDARFGGQATGYKGTTGNDSGNLDADQLTLETKSMYLDFNCPLTGTNMKVGIQPWADSYQSLFLLADMTGVYATRKFDALTASLGWFRFDDNTVTRATSDSSDNRPGQLTADLFVLDGKFAINKDMKVGASYYFVNNDTANPISTATASTGYGYYESLHMFGVNADMTFGPANIKPFFAYQMGDRNDSQDTNIDAFGLGIVGSVKAGPGKVNFAGVYLSGDDDTKNNDLKGWQNIADTTTYFNAANMWLIIENGAWTNNMTGVTGRDLNVGDRGLIGLFAGYEGTMDKVFYNANIGYAMTAEQRKNAAGVEENSEIGFELNATVGYKLFDNLSLSGTAAYAVLGDGLTDKNAAKRISPYGNADADDPYMLMTMLSYTF